MGSPSVRPSRPMWYSRTSGCGRSPRVLSTVRLRRTSLPAPVVLEHDDVVAEVRHADVRDPGGVEELRDLEREQQADALPRAQRCTSECSSSRNRIWSGDASRRSPRLSTTTRVALRLVDEVEQVVDPLVDVEIDRRSAQHRDARIVEGPAEARGDARELGGVLLERRQDRRPAVGGGAEREVETHQRLADAGRSGDERRRALPVPVAERVVERGDARRVARRSRTCTRRCPARRPAAGTPTIPDGLTRYACSPDRKPLPRSFRTCRTRVSRSAVRLVSMAMIASATANSARVGRGVPLVLADPERVRRRPR